MRNRLGAVRARTPNNVAAPTQTADHTKAPDRANHPAVRIQTPQKNQPKFLSLGSFGAVVGEVGALGGGGGDHGRETTTNSLRPQLLVDMTKRIPFYRRLFVSRGSFF